MHGGSHSLPCTAREILEELPTQAARLRQKMARWRKSASQGEDRIRRGVSVSRANHMAAEKRFVADALERAAELLEAAQDKLELMSKEVMPP